MALFQKKTVDQVLGALSKAQRELAELSVSLNAEADAMRAEASEIIAQADEAQAEADRASRVAERVSALTA